MNRNLRLLVMGLFAGYTGLLLLGTLSPFNFSVNARGIAVDHLATEWIPFTYWNTRCGWPGYFEDKLFNICIFIPFGVLLGLLIRSGPKPGMLLLKTTLIAGICSLAIEASQYFLPERHTTASDLLMNTMGGFLGAWLVARSVQVIAFNFGRTS